MAEGNGGPRLFAPHEYHAATSPSELQRKFEMKYQSGLRLTKRLGIGALAWAAASWTLAASPGGDAKPSPPALLQKMEGTWTVSEKMWPGKGQAAVDLPAATAHRRLIKASFLEEVMEPVQAEEAESFNRTAYFVFNFTTRQYEYFSLDSRLPQMMNERSSVVDPANASTAGISLSGGHFVAPTWGKAANVPFRYRLAVGSVKDDRQTVQLFLTPESGKDRTEFLAFEYLYTRRT